MADYWPQFSEVVYLLYCLVLVLDHSGITGGVVTVEPSASEPTFVCPGETTTWNCSVETPKSNIHVDNLLSV